MMDEEIDTSDIPPLDDALFANAKLRLPEGKVPVVMTVDADVFQWFRAQGSDYQNLINTALRIYAEEHKFKGPYSFLFRLLISDSPPPQIIPALGQHHRFLFSLRQSL
jgi:uncharacterized protein (DUF4415 family)